MSSQYGRTLEVDCAAMDFPLLSTNQKRTALITDIPARTANGLAQNEPPQILALENALPIKDGYASLDRINLAAADTGTTFEHVTSLTCSDGLDYLFAKLEHKIGVLRVGDDTWAYFHPGLEPFDLTFAQIDGETYVCLSGHFTQRFVPATTNFTSYELIGLDAGSIRGITNAGPYLLAFDRETIYWDNPSDRGNFEPEEGGAGSGKISQLRGQIVAVLPLANGFIVYSTTNAVGAQYTGNPNFPWVFREIADSAGVDSQYEVAWRTNLDTHLVWTKSGLQQVNFQNAQLGFPELSEFFSKRVSETFSFTDGFVRTKNTDPFHVKLGLIGHRYIVFSYGVLGSSVYEAAFIYDLSLKRWGKINAPHACFFGITLDLRTFFISYQQEYSDANRTYEDLDAIGMTYETYIAQTDLNPELLTQIASVGEEGAISYYPRTNLEAAPFDATFKSVIVIGKLSFLKNAPTLLHEFEVQNLAPYDGGNVLDDVVVFSSLTGDPFEDISASAVAPFLAGVGEASARKVYSFMLRKTANFFLFAFKCRFELTNLMVQYQPAGKRMLTGIPTTDGNVGFADTQEGDGYAYWVPIDATTVAFTVRRTATPGRRIVKLDYATSDVSAIAGVDYTAHSGTLTWLPGDASDRTINITVVDAAMQKDFKLTLSNPVGANLNAAVCYAASLGVVHFDATAYEALEPTSTVSIGIERVPVVVTPACSVHFATSDGTATAPDDYTEKIGDKTWDAGESGTKNFNVLVNNALTSPKTVNLTLSAPVGIVLGTPSTAMLTIDLPWVAQPDPTTPLLAMNGVASNGARLVAITDQPDDGQPRIIYSDDDGASWSTCIVPASLEAPVHTHTREISSSLILGQFLVTAKDSVTGTYHVYHSEDGQTFVESTLPDFSGLTYAFSDFGPPAVHNEQSGAGSLWIAPMNCNADPAFSNGYHGIQSSDNGATFSLFSLGTGFDAERISTLEHQAIGDRWIVSVFEYSASPAIYPITSRILTSVDAGASWNVLTSFGEVTGFLALATDGENIWITSNDLYDGTAHYPSPIKYSLDGGATFTSPGDTSTFESLAFVADTFFGINPLLGLDGQIYKTTNFGASWALETALLTDEFGDGDVRGLAATATAIVAVGDFSYTDPIVVVASKRLA